MLYEELAAAFRLLTYVFLVMGGGLGIYGIILGIYLTAGHLAGLVSFGIPYLSPFVAYGSGKAEGIGESIIRKPFRLLKYRPIYARRNQRVKMLRRENSKNNN